MTDDNIIPDDEMVALRAQQFPDRLTVAQLRDALAGVPGATWVVIDLGVGDYHHTLEVNPPDPDGYPYCAFTLTPGGEWHVFDT